MGMVHNVKVEIFKVRVEPFSRFAPKTLGKKELLRKQKQL
jgi:hypothetical protein